MWPLPTPDLFFMKLLLLQTPEPTFQLLPPTISYNIIFYHKQGDLPMIVTANLFLLYLSLKKIKSSCHFIGYSFNIGDLIFVFLLFFLQSL